MDNLKFKNIIFHFDGVLVESLDVKSDAFYEIYLKFGKEIAQKVVNHHKLNSGISRYEKFNLYHSKFLDISLKKKQVEILSDQFSKLVMEKVAIADEVLGARDFLERNNNDCYFWIVSATPEKELKYILNKRGISTFFKEVYGFPINKTNVVKNIINENSLNKDETLFVGDAKTDFDAAKDNNINFFLRETPENQHLQNLLKKENCFNCFLDFEQKIKN